MAPCFRLCLAALLAIGGAVRSFTDEEYAKLNVMLRSNAKTAAVGANGDVKPLPNDWGRRAAAAASRAQIKNPVPSPPPPPSNWSPPPDAKGVSDVDRHAMNVGNHLYRTTVDRLQGLLEDTETEECREKVSQVFTDVYTRLIKEDFLPFESTRFSGQCQSSAAPPNGPLLDPAKVRICYLLIVHEQPEAIRRLVGSLEEPGLHNFVIHVDGKAGSTATFDSLLKWSRTKSNVRVLEQGRQNVSWGGFNVVQATLDAMEYILDTIPNEFDHIVTMSGYTYPLASNREIRETLASAPSDTEYAEIRPSPNDPQARAWHQFVECDNKMRRIWRLQPPATIKMYMGSQWMVVTKQFTEYVVGRKTRENAQYFNKDGSNFASQYKPYGKHTMVADENYFVTVLKNSPFCNKHNNTNFLHVQFDKWENEKAGGGSNNKCLQPNPNHCGRSPTTLTLEYLPVLELGGSLFARKFDTRHDTAIMDAIDARRAESDAKHASTLLLSSEAAAALRAQEDEDFPFMPRVRIGRRDAKGKEYCTTIIVATTKGALHTMALEPCQSFEPRQAFAIGPCSKDGTIAVQPRGPAKVTPGKYAPAPFCPVHVYGDQMRSPGTLCLDLEKESLQPRTSIIAYPCSGRWNQLFGFGTGVGGRPSVGSVYINVPYPDHVPKELCLEAELPGEGGSSKVRVNTCDSKQHQTFFIEVI